MNKKVLLLLLLVNTGHASTPHHALTMVPKGKLVEQIGRDFIIKTEAGTKVHVEFKRNGRFEEAKGFNLNKGDHLEPGDGLLSLSTAAHALVKKGITPQGVWQLDYDEQYGWVYEMENTLIDAKSGRIINHENQIAQKKAP